MARCSLAHHSLALHGPLAPPLRSLGRTPQTTTLKHDTTTQGIEYASSPHETFEEGFGSVGSTLVASEGIALPFLMRPCAYRRFRQTRRRMTRAYFERLRPCSIGPPFKRLVGPSMVRHASSEGREMLAGHGLPTLHQLSIGKTYVMAGTDDVGSGTRSVRRKSSDTSRALRSRSTHHLFGCLHSLVMPWFTSKLGTIVLRLYPPAFHSMLAWSCLG
ncbi:hypothetical protein FA13DRAFT_377403 [Coprinellus micaceus]|uniref:Uncharacterized protein n=1 Tax=Coprinellus micaceus TaxID=71717 RepID=A0A4Y7SD05_COPMI|nr:hypothetical protein FA13DRAFT_377403 [Coprinellus micaceus]